MNPKKSKLLKVLPLSLVIGAICSAHASGLQTTYDFKQLPTAWRFNFELVKIPNTGEKKMGLLGVNYLVDANPWIYFGLGGYGAVSGDRGGLFVLGAEAGIHHKIIGNLSGEAGYYVGGGGGRSSLVGGGLMVRPHVGLNYDFKYFLLGAELSNVRFPNGVINSTQAALVLTIPDTITFSSPENGGKIINCLNVLSDKVANFMQFSENYIALLEQTYSQTHSSRDASGYVDTSSMSTIGVELGHYLNPHYFGFVKASGAFSGQHNGYMDILGGLGYRLKFTSFLKNLALKAKLAVGAGGGGNTDTGGGILLEPNIGAEYQITPKISVEVDGGYLFAPNGKFRATTLTLRLNYRLFWGSLESESQSASVSNALPWEFTEWRVRVVNQTYFRPQRTININPNINLVGVKFDNFITPNFYITGQGNSAYSGKNAGGYASGLVGLGLRSKRFWGEHFDVNAEMLVGAGGGGSLDVAGGVLLHPVVGLTYYFNHYLGLQAEVGRIFGPRGKLNATTLDCGLVFDFATLTR